MTHHSAELPRLLFLFSDTGGGHRSAAEAIIEAIQLEFGARIHTQMVDFFKDYAPPPLNKAPALYPRMVRLSRTWEWGFRLSNGRTRVRVLSSASWPYVRHAIQRLIAEHPSDLIVSVHPLAIAPLLRALGNSRPPFTVVVTDLVSTHAFWYHPQADLTIVPTQPAYQRALACGLDPARLRLVGLPVADRFCNPPGDQQELRRRLGWPQHLPMVLLVGGGEGMGPLEPIARAIATSGLQTGLAVVAGRNRTLKSRLEQYDWPNPTFIYGFVREMPDLMCAADVLVTKAGPGTISEALNAGLPMVLYSRLPGQEEGNVSYLVEGGAGVWAPSSAKTVQALHHWLSDRRSLAEAAAACQRLARPNAARQIARILAAQIHLIPVKEHSTP